MKHSCTAMRRSGDEGVGDGETILNEKTLEQVAKFRYLVVDTNTAEFMKAAVSPLVGEGTRI